jgi:diacylglycerol kinase family enzyme
MGVLVKDRAIHVRHAATRGRVAVLLNANAKKVGRRIRELYASIVPAGDLYLSRSLEEAERHLVRVLDRGYGTVFTGGGDGTVCHAINTLIRELERRGGRDECPRLGILKLGTGNAMSHVVSAHEPIEQLGAAIRGEPIPTLRLGLIEESGRLMPFAGIGWDAAILNDFISIKAQHTGRIGRRVFHSLLGYAAAITLKTIPRELFRRRPNQVRIRNLGEAVHLLPSGQQLPIPKGTLLFEGTCKFAGVAKSPSYGYGLRVFPFAGREPGKMHLRISTMGVYETLRNLPAIWKGTYRTPNLLDFLVDTVEIESDEPVPYQTSGDAMGTREKLAFRVSPHSVEILDFRPQMRARARLHP